MANTLISYNGENVYLNDDSLTQQQIIMPQGTELILNQNISHMFNNCKYLIANIDNFPFNYDLVTDMSYVYDSCRNLTGSPVCGPNVTNMSYAYGECRKLTGSPVCGPNVTSMSNAYYECRNLTGSPVCGPNVVNLRRAYYNCKNLTGDMYIYNTNIKSSSNFTNCFYNHINAYRINIHVVAESKTNNSLYSSNISTALIGSILGPNFTWLTNSDNLCYYNDEHNLYCYYDL